MKTITDEKSSLFFLYGCYLILLNKEPKHFSSAIEKTVFSIGALFLNEKINKSDIKKSFFFERENFYMQMHLYYHLQDNEKQKNYYYKKIHK